MSRRAFLGSLTTGAALAASGTVLGIWPASTLGRSVPADPSTSTSTAPHPAGLSRPDGAPQPAALPAPDAPAFDAPAPDAPAFDAPALDGAAPGTAQAPRTPTHGTPPGGPTRDGGRSGSEPSSRQPGRPGPAAGPLIMLIRHGEKPDDDSGPLGVDPTGRPDKHSLTQRGWTRAGNLANLFAPASGAPRTGLARPTAIYAAGANDDGEGARTRQTVGALAARLGIPVNTGFGKGDEAALARKLVAEKGPVLVCWQHGEIPVLAAALKAVTPVPPKQWPDNRYDMVWTFGPTGQGWAFSQVPEMVLTGDSVQTIR